MLNITLTPTAIWFNNLSDELLEKLSKDYDTFEFRANERGVYVPGNSQKLYKLLLGLTYQYDIELT